MKFDLGVASLLLLVAVTVTVKGSDLSDSDPNGGAPLRRAKRGFRIYDLLRPKEPPTVRPTSGPTKASGGNDFGFSLSDALGPDPKTSKPAGGNGSGFNLEDALHPAVKPTDGPNGGGCQANVVQKLSAIIETQNQQLRLLQKLAAR